MWHRPDDTRESGENLLGDHTRETSLDLHGTCCPNLACSARDSTGRGKIHVHSHKRLRRACTVGGATFSARQGTAFFRAHVPIDVLTVVLTLLAYGCPAAAIVAALGLQARTICRWQLLAGQHDPAPRQPLVIPTRALGQVQADELPVKLQGGIGWPALALVAPTRLWLGDVLSPAREKPLMRQPLA